MINYPHKGLVPVKATSIETGKSTSYASLADAGRALNIQVAFISAVLSGRNKTAKGYKFERLKKKALD